MKITLQSLTERAQRIHTALTTEFDINSAKQEASALYREGEQLVVAELRGDSLIGDDGDGTVLPVVVKLGKTLSSEELATQFSLLRPLIKAYRVFVELTWYQCCQQRLANPNSPVQKVHRTTRDAIIKNADDLMGLFDRGSAADTRFELRCTKEAAKWLTVNERDWSRYAECLRSALSALDGRGGYLESICCLARLGAVSTSATRIEGGLVSRCASIAVDGYGHR